MDTPQPLPAELLKFLETALDSLEKVETVWQLANANAPVRTSELREHVELDRDAMKKVIRELARARVVKVNGDPETVTLGPRARSPEFEQLIKLYAEDRVTVLTALTSLSMDRIRSMAARTFAEAFVLKRDLDDDD